MRRKKSEGEWLWQTTKQKTLAVQVTKAQKGMNNFNDREGKYGKALKA